MKKGLRKFGILAAVFVVAVIVFSHLFYQEGTNLTVEMDEAVLPVVYFTYNDSRVNEMHGYVDEMDASSVRDTITPVSDGYVLSLQIDTYGTEVENISFEVRSLDTERLVQESDAVNIEQADETVTADIEIDNLLSSGEEYILILYVTAEDDEYYYYTRITLEGDSDIAECLEFVDYFHGITMDKDSSDELASYMEPSSDADNTTLQTVDINSSLSQACWGDFEGTEVTEPVMSIKELNDSYNVIVLTYILSSEGDDGNTEYYNVEEYYRVRLGTEKVYLLSFERTVEEIFRGDSSHISGDTIILGIRSSDVDYMASETGKIICFVQQGELWSYNLDEDKLTQVYSFRSEEGMDIRENYNEHDIKIIRADETGSIDFIVYGYMNRGLHEGQVGISVCHYSSSTNTVEELVFLPANISYQMMKEGMGQLMYMADNGNFYINVGSQVYSINLETLEYETFISDFSDDTCVVSDSGRYVAWTSSDANEAEVLYLTDLEEETTIEIEAGDGCCIKPLGYSGDDCIYGIGTSGDITITQSGTETLVMKQIYIADSDGEILKTYENDGIYVTGVTVSGGYIYLERVEKTSDGYEETDSDTILNRDMQDEELVYVDETVSDIKQTEVVLQLSSDAPSSSPDLLVPKHILSEVSTTLDLGEVFSADSYYVYAKGRIILGTNSVTEAIISADENRGVVVGKYQVYVWKRGFKTSQTELAVDVGSGDSYEAEALSAIFNAAGVSANASKLLSEYDTVFEALQEGLEDYYVYDITGCDITQVLYYTTLGIPVYAEDDGGDPVLIVGYDSNYVWIYDIEDGDSYYQALEDASEDFESAGNIFYAVGEEK